MVDAFENRLAVNSSSQRLQEWHYCEPASWLTALGSAAYIVLNHLLGNRMFTDPESIKYVMLIAKMH